jgi:hypothetical protein
MTTSRARYRARDAIAAAMRTIRHHYIASGTRDGREVRARDAAGRR